MKKILIIFCFYSFIIEAKVINPITDICWECLFPMTVSGVNVTPNHKDSVQYNSKGCFCAGTPPIVGLPFTFWEPNILIDVTMKPYELIALGGLKIGKSSQKKRGAITHHDESGRSSFYHVHFYSFPILNWLKILTDFSCIGKGNLTVGYLSEFDLSWNDDQWSSVFHPEAHLFNNALTQSACVADCFASTFFQPRDELFWCAGCEGSLFPYMGYVSNHVGGVQASSLIMQRILSMLHKTGVLKVFKEDEFCEPSLMPLIKKSLYKTQLIHPIPQTKGKCHFLGKSDLLWGSNKSFPYKGEDFVYLIWTKKQCCLDLKKPAAATLKGGL